MKRKKKCENCADPIAHCGDCNSVGIVLGWQEAQDCISALSFFQKHRLKKGEEQTHKAMARLEKKLWKLKSEETQ